MNAKDNWKHGKFFSINEPDAVAIFDDEPGETECDAIYLMKDGKFSPCRTVYRGDLEHWRTVVGSWLSRAPALDLRQNKTIPLPV